MCREAVARTKRHNDDILDRQHCVDPLRFCVHPKMQQRDTFLLSSLLLSMPDFSRIALLRDDDGFVRRFFFWLPLSRTRFFLRCVLLHFICMCNSVLSAFIVKSCLHICLSRFSIFQNVRPATTNDDDDCRYETIECTYQCKHVLRAPSRAQFLFYPCPGYVLFFLYLPARPSCFTV